MNRGQEAPADRHAGQNRKTSLTGIAAAIVWLR